MDLNDCIQYARYRVACCEAQTERLRFATADSVPALALTAASQQGHAGESGERHADGAGLGHSGNRNAERNSTAALQDDLANYPAVALLGRRQSGKTTLAREISSRSCGAHRLPGTHRLARAGTACG